MIDGCVRNPRYLYLHSLLHLAGIFGTQYHHFPHVKIDSNRSRRCHSSCISIGRECTSIVNREIRLTEIFQFFSSRSNQHILHEQRVIRTSANYSNFDTVFWIPSGKPIEYVDAASSVQVIYRTLPVNEKDVFGEFLIYGTPLSNYKSE